MSKEITGRGNHIKKMLKALNKLSNLTGIHLVEDGLLGEKTRFALQRAKELGYNQQDLNGDFIKSRLIEVTPKNKLIEVKSKNKKFNSVPFLLSTKQTPAFQFNSDAVNMYKEAVKTELNRNERKYSEMVLNMRDYEKILSKNTPIEVKELNFRIPTKDVEWKQEQIPQYLWSGTEDYIKLAKELNEKYKEDHKYDEDRARMNEYSDNHDSSFIDKASETIRRTALNPALNFFNNLYSYGYYDSKLPHDTPIEMTQAVGSKILSGLFNTSKARKALKEFINLDLSDPLQRARAIELKQIMNIDEPKFGIHNGSIDKSQLSSRIREDLNKLYFGDPQQYNYLIENSDYTANNGQSTLIFKDPLMREVQRAFNRNVVNNSYPMSEEQIIAFKENLKYPKAGGYYISEDKKSRIYPMNHDPYSIYGNWSIITDADGSNGRYNDIWDFKPNVPGHYNVQIGDTF